MSRCLSKILDHSLSTARSCDLEGAKLIILSDQHKGTGNAADDFWRSEAAYRAALAYYKHLDYRLLLLGDAEELWEANPPEVLERYEDTLNAEASFGDRYDRFFGNHDLLWEDDEKVNSHLRPAFMPAGARVHEGLVLHFHSQAQQGRDPIGSLFLIHGHQGDLLSDLLAPASKPVVKYLWAGIQRRKGLFTTSPARDSRVRGEHDAALYEWAQRKAQDKVRGSRSPLVMIAGHTHRPVFWSTALTDKEKANLKGIAEEGLATRQAAGAGAEEIARLTAHLEALRALRDPRGDFAAIDMVSPCYFNTGCCSFPDGSITGIEISDGMIKLVRWAWPYGQERRLTENLDDEPPVLREELEKAYLHQVFDQIRQQTHP